MWNDNGQFLQRLIDRVTFAEYFEVVTFSSFSDFCAKLSESYDPGLDEVTCDENVVTVRALWLIWPALVIATGTPVTDEVPANVDFRLAYGLGYMGVVAILVLVSLWAIVNLIVDFGILGVPFVGLIVAGIWINGKRLAERRDTIRQWIRSAAHVPE